jgi:membrane protease YdiL (CAAX protease family)
LVYDSRVVLTYGLLIISIAILWSEAAHPLSFRLSRFVLLGSTALGWAYRFLDATGVGLIFILLLILHHKDRIKKGAVCGILLFLVGLLLIEHQFPGFTNLNVFRDQIVSKNGIPYTLSLEFDKALIGFFILSFYGALASNLEDWEKILKTVLSIGTVTVALTVSLSVILRFVTFEPKLVSFLPVWLAANLWLVCIPEEAFFRMLIQKHLLEKAFAKLAIGKGLALILTSALFGLAHFPGGVRYMTIAAVAGLGYGSGYRKTQKIETSILIHFLVNVVHILFFTYPALRTAF